jgi:hypothetical protein
VVFAAARKRNNVVNCDLVKFQWFAAVFAMRVGVKKSSLERWYYSAWIFKRRFAVACPTSVTPTKPTPEQWPIWRLVIHKSLGFHQR